MTAVEVCPICDIAGCHHIRERKAKMTHQTSSETTFNDEELIVRLRVGVPTVWEKQAADRIEALVKDRDQAWEVAHAATDRGMRAEAALAAQPSPDVEALVDALGWYADQFCEGFCQDFPSLGYTDENCERDCSGCKARAALARVKGVM